MATIAQLRPSAIPRAPIPNPDQGPLAPINDEGYAIAGGAALQRSSLVRIDALDQAGDTMRIQLRKVIQAQIEALREGQLGEGLSLGLAALSLLGVVDQLDEAEDGDPLTDATRYNHEIGESARRIISLTERPSARLEPIVA